MLGLAGLPIFRVVGISGPAVVNTNVANGSSGTPTANLPASIVAGNKLIVIAGCAGNETLATPSGWTLVGHATSGGTAGADRRLYAFEKIASGAEGATLAITQSGTAGAWSTIAYQVSGSASASLYAGTTGTGLDPDPPNNNPGTSAQTLWIAAALKRESLSASVAPSGYAGLVVARNGPISGMAANKSSTASSEDPGTFGTFAVSDNWAAITIGCRA